MKALFVALSLTAAGVAAHAQPANRYHVSVDPGATTARVTASLEMRGTTLAMYNVVPVDGLPNGQADLVENLAIRDAAGDVAFRNAGQGDFELERAGPIEVSYTVRLEHDRYVWPFGKEEVAYRTPEGVMSTGYALFLADAAEGMVGPFEVTFDLPEGWIAHTPWEPMGNGGFRVPTRRDLLVNALFLGTAATETIQAGGLELTLVLGAPFVRDRELFGGLLRSQSESYREMFGAPPAADRFLVVINLDPASDGGAFAGSFSQLIAGEASPASLSVWGVAMAHELLHFWNGLAMAPADDREEWFKEGVTDYLTTATLARNGFIEREMVFRRIENWPRRVLWARYGQGLRMSVREAGADKGANRQLIYGGGAVAALMLDAEMRVRSSDRVGLDDLMREMYAAHGNGQGGYSLDDIGDTAGELAGSDFGPFLAGLVEGEGLVDVGPALGHLGLRLDQFYDEVYVTLEPAATAVQRARFDAIFGSARSR